MPPAGKKQGWLKLRTRKGAKPRSVMTGTGLKPKEAARLGKHFYGHAGARETHYKSPPGTIGIRRQRKKKQ